MAIIYIVKNKVNNKIYIGKTLLTLEERRKKHFSFNKHPRQVFQFALSKYGGKNFIWDVLEKLDPIKDDINKAEKKWIQYYNSMNKLIGYNRSEGGDGGRKSEPDSEETKKKKSIGMMNNENALNKRWKQKKPMTIEHRLKISASRKGQPRPCSYEHRQKISKTMTGRKLTREHRKNVSIGIKKWYKNRKLNK